MSVPVLRFVEFSENWKSIHLGDLTTTLTSGSRDWAQHYSITGSKFIRMTNLSRDGIQLKLDDLKFVNVKSDSADGKRTSLVHGDILISITAELGKIGWIPPNFGEAFINQHTALVRLEERVADSRCVSHLLSTTKLNNEINKNNDSGAKAGLNLPTIKSLKITLPKKEEQTKIANFLTAVDEKIQHLTQKTDLLAQYKKGVMQQIFNQELRFKDDGGVEFPEWEEKQLGEVFNDFKGSGLSKDKIGVMGKSKCILYGHLFTKYSEIITNIYSRTDFEEGLLSKVNDILMPSSTTTSGIDLANASSLKEEGVLLGGDIIVLRFKESGNSDFFAYYLTHGVDKEIAEVTQGITIIHLYFKELKKLLVKVPSVAEQTKIANFLTAIDDKITQTKTQLAAVKQYKQGLLQQMFV